MRRIAPVLALAAHLLAGGSPASAQERWPISLYRDALHMEVDRKEPGRAIALYQKVIEKIDHPERGNMYAMLALYHIALCHEQLKDAEQALDFYKKLVEQAYQDPDVKRHPSFQVSEEKIRRNRVDIYLDQLCEAARKFKVRSPETQPIPDELLKAKKAIEERILPLDKEAIYGLRMGLDEAEPLCREFAADLLARVADEQAVRDLAADLEQRPSAPHRAGAAAALTYIIQRVHEGARLDAIAAEIERRFDRANPSFKAGMPERVPAEVQALIQAVFTGQGDAESMARKAIEEHRKRAAELRHNLPKALPRDDIVKGLAAVLPDSDPEVRLAACVAAGTLGDVRVEEPLVKVLDDPHPGVRSAAAVASGLVRTRMAVKPLTDLLVKDEPVEQAPEDPSGIARSAGRDVPPSVVRRNAAEALGRIGDVQAIPALVDALTDNDEFVRGMSHWALYQITRRQFKGKARIKVAGQEQEVEIPFTADMPLAARTELAAQWQAWYGGSKAVDVLIDRFRSIAFQWVDYNPLLLFDEEYFARRAPERQITPDEAKAFIQAFHDAVKQVEQDIAAVGPADAVPQLMRFIGGEGVDDPEKRDPAVRRFVAEALARMADDGVIQQLIALANDGSAPAARRTGAAIALGLLARPPDPAAVSQALQGLLNVMDATEVRVAAAEALGRLGAGDAAPALISKTVDPDPAVIRAVLRALSRLKPADAVAAVSELLKNPDQVKPPPNDMSGIKDEVLEFAAQALGDIASPEGLQPLVYARAHPRAVVWRTAQRSIEAILEKDAGAGAARRLLDWVTGENAARYKNQPLPYLRAFTCRALGDLPEALRTPEILDALVYQILDRNFPKEVRDYDLEVRKAAAEGLVKIKSGEPRAAGALIRCLADGKGIPLLPKDLKAAAEKGLQQIDDIRGIAALGLEVSVDDPVKPPVWETQDPKTLEEVKKEQERWDQFRAAWEGWLARKEGKAPAPAPQGPEKVEKAPAPAPEPSDPADPNAPPK